MTPADHTPPAVPEPTEADARAALRRQTEENASMARQYLSYSEWRVTRVANGFLIRLLNDADALAAAEAARRAAESAVERLNQMLRQHGYGQGQIDAYVDQCEELEAAHALLRECGEVLGPLGTLGGGMLDTFAVLHVDDSEPLCPSEEYAKEIGFNCGNARRAAALLAKLEARP